jgi:hypothetical protein
LENVSKEPGIVSFDVLKTITDDGFILMCGSMHKMSKYRVVGKPSPGESGSDGHWYSLDLALWKK